MSLSYWLNLYKIPRSAVATSIVAAKKLEVSIEHIPHANVYGIECYNYSSSADNATPRD